MLAKEKFNIRGRELETAHAEFVPFTARTRMSGVNMDGRQIRKGAADAVERFVEEQGGSFPSQVDADVDAIARQGGTPLVVAENNRVLGTVYLKDIVKGGIKERFAELRRMGIKTVMITGDNPQTAAAIAAEAGVDDFLAEATPEAKLDAHPATSEGRASGRHDRRRHERRARTGPSRRGRRHEYRHAGRQGSGQHG